MLLEGVRVIEAGGGIAPAYCGRVLRSLGALVVKLEAAGERDWLRDYGAPCATHPVAASAWCHLNGAKARAVLGEGAERAAEALLATADIVVAGPDALGERAAAACPPGAVLVQIVAAVDGPAGFAVAADESAGVAAGLRDPYTADVPPDGVRMDIAQVNAGAHAAATVALALAAREMGTAEPARIRVGIYESAVSMIEIAAQNVLLQGRFGGDLPDLMTTVRMPYVCSDGGMVAINLWGKDVWARMCAVMERPEMAADSRFIDTVSRWAHGDAMREILGAWCASLPRDEAVARMRAGLIPSAPILGFDETLRDEQLRSRQLVAATAGHPAAVGSCYVIDGVRDALPYVDAAAARETISSLGLPGIAATIQEATDAVLVELR